MKPIKYSFHLVQLTTIVIVAATKPVVAEELNKLSAHRDLSSSQISNHLNNQQVSDLKISTSAKDLLVQNNPSQEVVEVTGVQISQTERGLEIILETTGEEQLSSLILPEENKNNLVIEILDTVLALPTGDEFRETNPVEGITEVRVTQVDATSIRVTITGENNAPSAEVILSDRNLVLEVTPEVTAETEIDEEIEIIVTAEGEEDYFVPDASTATRTDTQLLNVPQSIQVVPQEVLEDQQVTSLDEALRNVSGVVGGTTEGTSFRFAIRGFERAIILRDGFRLSASDNLARSGFQNLSEVANLERIEVLKGPASILYGELNPGGVINLVTKKPLAEPFYEAELAIGNRDFFEPRIDFSGPLTSDNSLLYRLNALYQNQDDFRDFEQNIERFFISPVLTWNIGERTELRVELEYLDDERPYDTGLIAFGEGVIDIPRDRILNEPGDFNQTETLITGYTLNHRFSENWQLRNRFQYARQDRDGVVAIPIMFDEATGNLLRADSSVNDFRENYALQTNVVGEFATGSIEHKLLFGVDFSETNVDLLTEVNISQPLPLNVFDPVYDAFPRDVIPILKSS
ncbi:TonB-dependent siderophore receptor [Pleurocapsales cyanobacterium LEGE 06147]|nr:TonB-dependent siderophore receptor [Pleurocapsales cyanobacterium LEGE 06147]